MSTTTNTAGSTDLGRTTVGGLSSSQKMLSVYSALLGVAFALPLLYLLTRAVIGLDQSSTDFGKWNREVWEPAIKTLTMGGLVSVSAAALGTSLAWLIQRRNTARRLMTTIAILPLAIPSYIGALALIGAYSGEGGIVHEAAGLIGIDLIRQPRGLLPAWFVMTIFTYPYVFMVVRSQIKRLDPAVEESAQLLGRTPRQVFYQITLPQLRPAILSGTLLVFLYSLSEYGAVQLLRYDTLTRVVYTNFLTDTFVSASASLLLATFAIIAISAERRFGLDVRSTLTKVGVDNRDKDTHHEQRRTAGLTTQIWRIVLIGVVALLALVVPLSTFAYWALRAFDQANLTWASTLEITGATIATGVITGLVTMFLIVPVAQLTLHSKSIVSKLSRTSILAGYATPGVVIALALVFWNLRVPGFGWLYQTYAMLLFGYIIHFGSLGLGSAESALAAVPKDLKESARLLHPSRVKRWTRVHLPLMRPGIFSGVGLIMLATIKELPATLKLAPTGFSTLATDIFSASGEGFDARTGILSLILISVSALLTWVLIIRNEN